MRYVVLAVLALGACEAKKPSSASASDGGAAYVVVDAGPLRPCGSAADCAARGPGSVCYFPQSVVDSPLGVCGGPQPLCAVSHPFCGASGRTVFACTFPGEPWTRRGACPDASGP